MQYVLESISNHIESWGMIWFGLIFLGSIFNEFSILNLINISVYKVNLFPYLLGLTIGIIAKLRGRWI